MEIDKFFKIDPKQKNPTLIFLSIVGLCFLQLYIFKKDILLYGISFTIGISIGLAICTMLINFIPAYFYYIFGELTDKTKYDDNNPLDIGYLTFSLGIYSIFWISLTTFVSYEIGLSFKCFIRLMIAFSILRSLYWTIRIIIFGVKNKWKV